MQKEFLQEAIVYIVGKPGEELATLLNSDKHVNEFLIAKKLDITINQTRNLLYKISDQGIVSSIRKKDKKKGWFTYFWKLENLKALDFVRSILLKKMDQLSNQIKSRESKQFYVCETCNIEYNEENALIHDFTCQECGNVFVLKDNVGVLKELKKNYSKFQAELGNIEQEINLEKEKVAKKNVKSIKKNLKAVKKKKEEDSIKRKKEKASEESKKNLKKPTKIIKKQFKKIPKKKVIKKIKKIKKRR